MFGFFRDTAFRGLVSNIGAKLATSMNLPKEAHPLVLPMAVMVAHASYPKAKMGIAEVDAAIARLPQPIVNADSAGKIAHRFAYLHEITLNDCLQQQYGKTLQELMVFFEGTCLSIRA
jgi:hypothetical protein